jgi:hypothetical protein
MPFHAIDGYLLDGRPSKAAAIAAALGQRIPAERAQPFYRALEAVGDRAADEALIALRLVIADKPADDDAVRRLRALAMLARAADAAARDAAFAKAGPMLDDLAALRAEPNRLPAAARAAYLAML